MRWREYGLGIWEEMAVCCPSYNILREENVLKPFLLSEIPLFY